MRRIDHILYQAIRERREGVRIFKDMLSLLIHTTYDDGNGMSDKQIRDEALTLLVTGYETIGEALAWTWYLLSQHPDVESKFLAELREVLDGRFPCVADLPKLRYTAMVLAESMRLFPPTWMFVRMASQVDILPSGVTIPAGAKLYLCQYVMHRNARYWPNSDRFDPERFTEAAKKERPQFSYFPFSGGARACIGEHFAKMEGILVLAMVAQQFKLTLVPGQTIVPEPMMTLRSKKGIMMRIQQRDQCEPISQGSV